jgi:hypothetical protein
MMGETLRGHVKTGEAMLGAPMAWERTALIQVAGDRVVRFERLRTLANRASSSWPALPSARRFPDLKSRSEI